ncbi:MAG: flippase-like domain-containing protein [Clostridia bacterium]|nr:flippase-like domain-containing protein [Clostridia bacterium]
MKDKKYYFLNLVVLVVSLILLCSYVTANAISISFSFVELSICLMLFLVLNLLKFLRLYIVFLEEKIPIKNYIKTYIKTTFVNIIIPFKLGELYRIYCFNKETNNIKKSIIGILIDRLVDTIVLLAFLIPIEIVKKGKCSNVTLLLMSFVLVFIVFIIVVPTTYKYLNKFFIINSQTKTSLHILKVTEFINDLYRTGKDLLNGRFYLLTTISILSWAVDYTIVKIISCINLKMFNLEVFTEYLNSALFKPNGLVILHYSIIMSVEFVFIGIITYGLISIKGGKNK